MQINRLEFQAIGPFAKKHVIDFQQIQHEKGLFLINGDTGSGKTTLLDAIVFALYNQVTSSENNGEEKLRCAYASPETESYVCLDFESGGAGYRIRRSPKYLRPKKRGEGLVEQPAQVSLFKLDESGEVSGGALATKAAQVGEQLSQILPLDRQQFLQTVILPQGDFARFLHADTKSRKQILERIFKTDIYSQIEQLLADRSRQIRQELSRKNAANRQLLDFFLQSTAKLVHPVLLKQIAEIEEKIASIPDTLVKEQSAILKESYPQIQEIFNTQHQEYRQTALAQEQSLNKHQENHHHTLQTQDKLQEYYHNLLEYLQLETQSENIAQISKRITLYQQGKPLNTLFPSLQSIREELENTYRSYLHLAPQNPSPDYATINLENVSAEKILHRQALSFPSPTPSTPANQLVKQLSSESLAVELAKLGQEITSLSEQEKSIQTQLKQITQLRELQQSLAKNQADLDQALANLPQTQKEFYAITTALKLLQNKQQQSASLSAEITSLENILLSHTSYHDSQKEINSLREKRVQLAAEISAAESLKEQAHSHYRQIEKSYQEDAIATLLPLLSPTTPCPVCGSLDHPNPAQATNTATSLSDLQAATQKLTQARSSLEQLRQALAEIEAEINQKQARLSPPKYLNISVSIRNYTALKHQQLEYLSSSKAVADLIRDGAFPVLAQTVLEKLPAHKSLKGLCLSQAIAESEKAQGYAHNQLLGDRNRLLTLVKEKNSLKEQIRLINPEIFNDINKLDSLSDKLVEIRQLKTQKITWKEHTELLLARLGECQKQEQDFQRLLRAQGFSSEEAYLASQEDAAHMPSLQKQLEHYQQTKAQLETLLNTGKPLLPTPLDTENHYPELARQLQEYLPVLAQQIAVSAQQLEQLNQSYQSALTQLHTWENQSKTAEENYSSWQQALVEAEKYYLSHQPLLQLAGVALASTQNAQSLSSWVLVDKFQEVLSYANPYLNHISAGRYQLRVAASDHSRKADQALSLVVFDGNSDRERAVASLSGGESFYCSLSLALGLAEAVTAQAGGITLGTMFIDEGFGTLDEEKREAVLHALGETSSIGRKIGLISHVDTLKENLSEQIVVKTHRIRPASPLHSATEAINPETSKGSYLHCTWEN